MYSRRITITLLILTMIFSLSGCGKTNPPAGVGNQVNEENPLLKPLGFENGNIEQIQVAADGKVYVLSEAILYVLEGQEFKAIGPDEPVSLFYIMEGDEPLLVAGSKTGSLYIKQVQDRDWQKAAIKTYAGPIDAIAGDVVNDYIYVGQATKQGGGLWRSSDKGKTWKKVTGITARCIVVHPQNADILYLIDRATYLSTNQGINWGKLNTAANFGVLIHPLDPELAYIAFPYGVVVARHNGKITATQRFSLPGALTCLEMDFARLGEWAVGMWDYPSGSGGLYYSLDAGSHWIKIEEDIINTRITDLRFDKAGDRLYIGTAGKGIWVLNIKKLRDKD